MGLAEKRLAQQVQQNDVPKFQEQLKTTLGYEPALEILWDTFTAYDSYPLSRLTGVVFRDLNNGLKDIAKDDLGKEALKEAIASIKFENTDDPDATVYSLKNKELYMKLQLAGQNMKAPTAAQFRDWLEKQL
ncbi:MAG: hypothetical protein ACKV1O_00615 [Saprospiraceae bacterium]